MFRLFTACYDIFLLHFQRLQSGAIIAIVMQIIFAIEVRAAVWPAEATWVAPRYSSPGLAELVRGVVGWANLLINKSSLGRRYCTASHLAVAARALSSAVLFVLVINER